MILPLFEPQCLNVKGSQDDIHSSFKLLLKGLHQKIPQCTLSVANRLYGEKSYDFVKVCGAA